MTQYTIYCTEEQTKKALELGAPIEDIPMYMYGDNKFPKYVHKNEWNNECFSYCPTAEQMIGWIEEQEEISDLHIFKPAIHWTFELYASNGDGKNNQPLFNSRQEATLAAIDAALKYLTNNKK